MCYNKPVVLCKRLQGRRRKRLKRKKEYMKMKKLTQETMEQINGGSHSCSTTCIICGQTLTATSSLWGVFGELAAYYNCMNLLSAHLSVFHGC